MYKPDIFSIIAVASSQEESIDLEKVCRALKLLKSTPHVCHHNTKKIQVKNVSSHIIKTYYKSANFLLEDKKQHLKKMKKAYESEK